MTMRLDYGGDLLPEPGEGPGVPWPLVQEWVLAADARQASHGDQPEPRAMAVATRGLDGVPDVREVLCRFLDPRGPGFVTDAGSAKARQLEADPGVAASLTWPGMFRALRFRGRAEQIGRPEVEEYWHSRPYGSRISHWASEQSSPLAARGELDEAVARCAQRWPDDGPRAVPVPEDFVGVRLVCTSVELWAGRPSRLHDRLRFERSEPGCLDESGAWDAVRLQP